MSGTDWPVTLSDMLLALGVLLLLFEVIKGARPGAKYLTDHLLSLLVFGAAAAEFVLLPQFGTSTFFLLTLLALVDFLSGIALRTRRGTQVASAPAVSRRGAREAEAGCARTAVRTAVRAGSCSGSAGRRIRAARSRRAENRASRGHAARALAGGAVPGIAAGRRFAPVAGQRRASSSEFR